MIGPVHHKLHTFGNSTELPDNQLVTYEVIEVRDMLLKLVCTVYVIVIGIVTDDDSRVLYHVFDVTEAWNVRIRESLVGVWPVFAFIGYNLVYHISLIIWFPHKQSLRDSQRVYQFF